MPNLRSLPTSDIGLELRPLPSPGITRLHRYYGPLRHPRAPGLTLTGCQLTHALDHALGLPVLRLSSSFMHAIATTPAETLGLRVARFTPGQRPSPYSRRVGFRIKLFEACSAFTRVTACMLAKFLSEPSTPEASAASLPPRLLQLLPAGATVAGQDSHLLKDSAFSRRTKK